MCCFKPLSYSERYAKGLLSLMNEQDKDLWKAAFFPSEQNFKDKLFMLLQNRVLPYLENFLELLYENDRLNNVESIFKAVQKLLFSDHIIIKIITASVLDISDKKEIENILNIGNAVYLYAVKKELLGGMLIECNNKCIDVSVYEQLRKIETLKR